jgi:endoglucanase
MTSLPQHSIRLAVLTGFSLALALGSCSGSSPGKGTGGSLGGGGVIVSGGAASNGGTVAKGGSTATPATGGMPVTGGSIQPSGGATGGTSATGGSPTSGGSPATGGFAPAGGSMPTSGTAASGGTTATGGATSAGGAAGGTARGGGTTASGGRTGGTTGAGGTTNIDTGTGGTPVFGGTTAAGGNTGGSRGGTTSTGGATSGGSTGSGDAGLAADTSSFRCVNWSDPGDNYQTGNIQPTGLSATTDTYATALVTANAILSGFQTVLKANSIRVGINEPTVSGTWWTTGYKAIIDAATSQNFKVILGYWAHHNGKPDDVTAFNTMWQTVVTTYSSNPLVYFDIGNEPYGYTESAWADLVAQWLALFPNVPRARVLVAGVVTGNGWDADVTQVGADSRLNGTLLNLHVYPSNSNSLTAAGWEQVIKQKVGAYSSRTVATEWGAPLSGGVVYSGTGTPADVNAAYMMGVPEQFRAYPMGGCLWAGLEGSNGMGLTKINGSGSTLTLTVTNASALARLQYSWGL